MPYSRSLFTPGIGTGYLPSAFGITGAGPLHRKFADVRRHFVRAGEDLIEGDFLSGVGGHAAHVRHQAGLHGARHFVVRLVLRDRAR